MARYLVGVKVVVMIPVDAPSHQMAAELGVALAHDEHNWDSWEPVSVVSTEPMPEVIKEETVNV